MPEIYFLCKMHTKYLIVGQGISGTMLSWFLHQAGEEYLVIDEYNEKVPSRVAGGVINPVTGRRIARSWIIEDLLPFAEKTYEDIGEFLGVEAATTMSMYSFHATEQMHNAWIDKINEGDDYLSAQQETSHWQDLFHFEHGVGVTDPCMVVNLQVLLDAWRSYLKKNDRLLQERYEIDALQVYDEKVVYKDIEAQKLIFCNGTSAAGSRYFRNLPYAISKGQALVLNIPKLPENAIYKQGLNMAPQGNGLFWLGSSFEWEYEHDEPTQQFRERTEAQLKNWLKLPYEVVEERAAIRIGCIERRPFAGLHPKYPSLGILNGMGTKGCSLAPYFAYQLVENLLNGKDIHPKADVQRFKSVLNRE